MSDITLEQARKIVEAAFKKAEEIGAKMNICVVDAGANLKAFARMDDAWLGSSIITKPPLILPSLGLSFLTQRLI